MPSHSLGSGIGPTSGPDSGYDPGFDCRPPGIALDFDFDFDFETCSRRYPSSAQAPFPFPSYALHRASSAATGERSCVVSLLSGSEASLEEASE